MQYGFGTFACSARTAAIGLLTAGCLVACGGGGGGGGTPLSGTSTGTTTTGTTGTTTGTGTTTTTPVASSLLVAPGKTSLNNSGTDTTALVVTAVDASGNALSGVTVNVAVNSNAVYTRDATTVTGTNGTVSGVIGIGSDKSNRLITYTATSGSVTKVGTIAVTGTTVTGNIVPAVPLPGAAVALTVTVADSLSTGIAGVPVTVSGIAGVTLAPQTTSNNGKTVFNFNAPSTVGNYPVTISANGVSSDSLTLAVANTGSTTIPAVTAAIVSQSVIANPVVVAANTTGSSTNQSEVRALFLTNNNVALPNVRVRFRIMSSALTGESLTANGSTVYSDATGVAKTSYVAPMVGSPTNGVVIRACYGASDTFDFTACFASATVVAGQSVETALTVASSPVSLTIGSDNVIEKTNSGISYVKKFEIQAVDAAGNYAPNVPLSAVVDIAAYRKGPAVDSTGAYGTSTFCANEDADRNNVLGVKAQTINGVTTSVTEDTNADGILTPRKSDVSIGFVNSVRTTDSTGLALLQITYPQNVATWEVVNITVTAGVTGSEGSATYTYFLSPSKEDLAAGNGSFLVAPYGSSSSCGSAL